MPGATTKSTGPASMYLKFAVDQAPVFLGYSKTSPRIEIDPAFSDVTADPSGPVKPFARSYGGKSALIAATLSLFDWNVYLRADDQPFHRVTPATAGIIPANAIGCLTNGAMALYVKFEFYGTACATNDLVPGYYFPNVVLGPQVLDPIGTRPAELSVVFEATTLFDSSTRSHVLYRNDTNLFASLIPTFDS